MKFRYLIMLFVSGVLFGATGGNAADDSLEGNFFPDKPGAWEYKLLGHNVLQHHGNDLGCKVGPDKPFCDKIQLIFDIARAHPWIPWLNRLGLLLTTFILVGAGAFYVSRVAPTITIRRAWAIAGLLWITMAVAKAIAVYQPIGLVAIAPTLLVAIILVIAENPRFALGLAALHGLLVVFTIRRRSSGDPARMRSASENTMHSSRELLARRLAPCKPVHEASPAA